MAVFAKESVLNRLPLIVILGATGTGKSKLALEVAQKFGGEIISADAMQVYRGLDVITNKVTAQEQLIAPHHMIDYLCPGQPTTVTDFRDRALPIIQDILSRNRLPVVAGGTYYYVEALLWHFLVDTQHVSEPSAKKPRLADFQDLGPLNRLITDDTKKEMDINIVDNLSKDEKDRLHEVLREVDPARADELHPNNVRKVIRSLQVFRSTGRRHSDFIKEQREAGGNNKGGPLRYSNCVVFWISCDQEVLNERLKARVDQMISQGLIEELLKFHEQYNKQRVKEENGEIKQPSYTMGIFQSIGFKEFHDYLMLTKEQQESAQGKKLFDQGLSLMKLATIQYAKRQVKWIKRRFLARGKDQVPPVFKLNVTDINKWNEEVRDKTYSVVEAMLNGEPIPVEPEEPLPPSDVVFKLVKCEQCDRLFESPQQLQHHLGSQKHKRRLAKLKRQEEEQNSAKTTEKTAIKT